MNLLSIVAITMGNWKKIYSKGWVRVLELRELGQHPILESFKWGIETAYFVEFNGAKYADAYTLTN